MGFADRCQLVPLLATLAAACSSSGTDSPDSGPVTTLDDFRDAGYSIYCPPTRAETNTTCDHDYKRVFVADCSEVWAVFTSNWVTAVECVYEQDSGELVGARYVSDHQPTRSAGQQVPEECEREEICSVWTAESDGGTDATTGGDGG